MKLRQFLLLDSKRNLLKKNEIQGLLIKILKIVLKQEKRIYNNGDDK